MANSREVQDKILVDEIGRKYRLFSDYSGEIWLPASEGKERRAVVARYMNALSSESVISLRLDLAGAKDDHSKTRIITRYIKKTPHMEAGAKMFYIDKNAVLAVSKDSIVSVGGLEDSIFEIVNQREPEEQKV